MAELVSDYVLKRLSKWGVKRIYGFPGDGINGIMGALDRGRARSDFVQVRHEEMAAFMACAHAKFTGEVGVCMATSGPGAIHLLNGLYDAKLDHQPVVAIVGQQARSALGGDYQQEVDLDLAVQGRRARLRAHGDPRPAQVRHLIDRAMRIAKAERTVTCVIVPNDVQELEAVEAPPRAHGTVHSGIGYVSAALVPHDEDLRARRATCSTPARRSRCWSAPARSAPPTRSLEVADLLGAGVAKALLGKAVAARRPAVRHRLDRPARHQAELGPDDGLRHAADGRLAASPTRSSCRRRARPAACRSTSTAACSASAIRWRSTWSATPPRRCARSSRCSKRKEDRALARAHRARRRATGGRCSRPAP